MNRYTILTILGLLALAACSAVTKKEVTFEEPACNVTFKPEGAHCTTLVKCVTKHERLRIDYKNMTGRYAVYSIFTPGDPSNYSVTVFEGGQFKKFDYTFPFYELCDAVMYMSKQYNLWPPTPQACVENTGSFCCVAFLITAVALICTLLYIKFRQRRIFIDEKKMP